MRNAAFTILVFINGLVLGILGGILLLGPGADPADPSVRYRLDRQGDQIGFFDQTTGRYTAFNQHEGFWFVMVYDPQEGSVTYKETRLIEDPTFLKAAERLRSQLPEQLGRELRLERLRE